MPFYDWPTYIHLCVGIISGFISIGMIVFAWRRRYTMGAIFLIFLSAASLLWSVAYIFEIISWTNSAKSSAENFQYLAISLFPIIYFGFVRLYSAWKTRVKNFIWVLLFVHPVLSQVIAWTNPLHHWFVVDSHILYPVAGFPGIHLNEYGWYFWFFSIYTLVLLLIDLIMVMIAFFRTPLWARGKLLYITVGMALPWLTSLISLPQLITSGVDYYFLISVVISMLLIGLGLLRVQITDLLPIARKTLLDQLSDAVMVLDADGRIIEYNHTARKIFSDLSPGSVGRMLSSFLPQFPLKEFSENLAVPDEIEISLGPGSKDSSLEARISKLLDEDQMLAGWLVTFHDVTRRKQETERLLNAEAQTKEALKNVQRHSAELTLLRLVNEQLNEATSLRQALIPTLRSILEITHGSMICTKLLEVGGQSHRTIQYLVNEKEGPLVFHEASPNDCLCMQDLAAGKMDGPTRYSTCDCRMGTNGGGVTTVSHMAFPMRSGTSLLGLINVALENDKVIDGDSIHLIETICDSLSVAVERVRLFKVEYDQRRLAETMQEIGTTLTASLDLNEVLDLLLEQINRLVPYDAGNIMFLDEDTARVARSRGYEFLGKKMLESIISLTFPIKNTTNIRTIVETRRPLFVSDVRSDPNWLETAGSAFFHSWIGAPVIIKDKVVAIFSLDKKEAKFYNQTHADHLAALSSNAALAIENARLFEAGVKRIRELESLQDTLKDITSELDLTKLLEQITARAVDLLDASGGILGLYEKSTSEMKIIVGVNTGIELIGSKINVTSEVVGILAGKKEPFVVRDYSTWDGRVDELVKVFPHALMQVPLVVGDELLGAIAISSTDPLRAFNPEEVRLISLFAQQATIALTNARLYSDAKRRAEEAETMRQASAIVASSLEQKQALRLILEQLALVIPCDSASILLPRGDELEIVDGRGFTQSSNIIGLRVPMGDDQPGSLVIRKRKPVIVSNMDKEFPAFNNMAKLPIKSWIGVPLIFQKEIIGLLAIDSLKENDYTEDHARLAQAFADQVAISLENVRLYEEAVKAAKRLAGIYKVSQLITANLKPEEVYRAIHKATIELMNPDAFILSLYDEEEKLIHDVYFVDHGIPQKVISRPLGQGFSRRILKEKKTIMYNDFSLNMLSKTKAVLVGEEKDPTMVRSLIIVPLKLGKKVKGIISAQSYRGDAFTEEDKETLELLAATAVIALENARLFSEVQELALTDSLTRIFNRRRFFDLAEQEFDRSRRYDRPFSLIMFDIDHFKKVNDTYGHSVGDVVLQRVAEICKGALRDVDIIARYGGEEFVILLPETTATEAQLMAERLRQLMARSTMEIAAIKIDITLSFGVVEIDKDCKNIEELLDRSDQALYHSKNAGRNCVSIWTPDMRLHEETNGKNSHLHH